MKKRAGSTVTGAVTGAITISFCLLLVGLPASVYAASTVLDVTIETDAMPEGTYDFRIYLPDGYVEGGREYPVVYFLHGYGYPISVHWSFFQFQSRLDNYIATGLIQPIIFVTPDGYGHHYGGNFYANSELYGNVEDCIVEDLVAYVEDNFEVISRRTHRVIMGHSMGGLGAMQIALRHPDVYGAVASHAGVLILPRYLEDSIAGVLGEAGTPPFDYHPENGSATMNMFAAAGAYSPNLGNPPYFVDFPLDENGDVIEEVVERWWVHDPPALAREYAQSAGDSLCIALLCGTSDGLIVHSEAFAESLDVLGVSYDFMTHPGGHTVLPLDMSLPYLLNPETPCGIVGVADLQPNANVTMRVLPNPSRLNSTFEFALPKAETVTLIVYDVGGRAVRSVFDGPLDAGPHSLTWDGRSDAGSQVADGVYFVALRTGVGTEVMRTVRLK